MFFGVHNLPIFTQAGVITTGYSAGVGMWLSHGWGRSGVDLPRLISAWWSGAATGYSLGRAVGNPAPIRFTKHPGRHRGIDIIVVDIEQSGTVRVVGIMVRAYSVP